MVQNSEKLHHQKDVAKLKLAGNTVDGRNPAITTWDAKNLVNNGIFTTNLKIGYSRFVNQLCEMEPLQPFMPRRMPFFFQKIVEFFGAAEG